MEFFLASFGEAKGPPEAGDESVADTGEETTERGCATDDAILFCFCCCLDAIDADNGEDGDDVVEFVKIVLSFKLSDILRDSCFGDWTELAMAEDLEEG